MSPVRVYLAGRVAIETPAAFVDSSTFPGGQGRVAFAYLVCERGRPVSRSELAELLWPGELASAWDAGLNAIISKLRSLLARVGLNGSTLTGARGYYELRLPGDAWVDIEAAAEAIHEAESALRLGDITRAYGPSAVAHHITRRTFVPGEQGAWVEGRRQRLRSIWIRALECRAQVYLANGEFTLAVEAARDAIELEPFRETSHRLLMTAHANHGNAAEALWTYERCRQLIAAELGVDPSPETKALYERILRSV